MTIRFMEETACKPCVKVGKRVCMGTNFTPVSGGEKPWAGGQQVNAEVEEWGEEGWVGDELGGNCDGGAGQLQPKSPHMEAVRCQHRLASEE